MKREDFPPGVPTEKVDRILALAERTRPSTMATIVFVLATVGVPVGFFVMLRVAQWSNWSYLLILPLTTGVALLYRVFGMRRAQKVIVEMGQTCPRCHKPLFTETWSMSKATKEREALMQGYCPRCFEHIGPNVTAMAEEVLASKGVS